MDSSGLVRGSSWYAGKAGSGEGEELGVNGGGFGANGKQQGRQKVGGGEGEELGSVREVFDADEQQQQQQREGAKQLGIRGNGTASEVDCSNSGSSSNGGGRSNSNQGQQLHMQHQQQQQEEEDQQQHLQKQQDDLKSRHQEQQQQQELKAATPPFRVRASKAWRIETDRWGMVAGVSGPTKVNRELQELLDMALAVSPGQSRSNMAVDHGQTWSNMGPGKRLRGQEVDGEEGGQRWSLERWQRQQQQQQGEQEAMAAAAAAGGVEWQQEQVELLLSARGADMRAVCEAADQLRRRVCGDEVTYVVNRNINYTNVCTYGCTFCAFSKVR